MNLLVLAGQKRPEPIPYAPYGQVDSPWGSGRRLTRRAVARSPQHQPHLEGIAQVLVAVQAGTLLGVGLLVVRQAAGWLKLQDWLEGAAGLLMRLELPLADIKLQTCFFLRAITEFSAYTADNKLVHLPGQGWVDFAKASKVKDENGIPKDGIPFHPYYTVKDIVGVIVFLILFSMVLFFIPDLWGWFLEKDNFIPADPLKTPEHIVPLWYFTPFYAILRAVPPILNSQFPGVAAMGMAIVLLFLVPWLDRSPVRSIRYRGGIYKFALAVFVVSFLVLGWLGTQPAGGIYLTLSQIFSILYFAFFILMPWYTSIDKTKPVPERVTDK